MEDDCTLTRFFTAGGRIGSLDAVAAFSGRADVLPLAAYYASLQS